MSLHLLRSDDAKYLNENVPFPDKDLDKQYDLPRFDG